MPIPGTPSRAELAEHLVRTRIAGDVLPGAYQVKALTAIPGQALVSVEGSGMIGVPGVAARTFTALASAGHSVSMISQASSESSICFVVPDPEADHSVRALRDAFAKNGYSDAGKIEQLIAPLTKELKEGTWITIRYDAAAKKTTLSSSVGSSVVPGADFMKATWSIWFGNIDQPALSDSLVSKIQ